MIQTISEQLSIMGMQGAQSAQGLQKSAQATEADSFAFALKALQSGNGDLPATQAADKPKPDLMSIGDTKELMSILNLLTPQELSELARLLTAYTGKQEDTEAAAELSEELDRLGVYPAGDTDNPPNELMQELAQLISILVYQPQQYIADQQQENAVLPPLIEGVQAYSFGIESKAQSNLPIIDADVILQAPPEAATQQYAVQGKAPTWQQAQMQAAPPQVFSLYKDESSLQQNASTNASTDIIAAGYTPSQQEETAVLLNRLQSESALRPSLTISSEAEEILANPHEFEQMLSKLDKLTPLGAQMSVQTSQVANTMQTHQEALSQGTVSQLQGKITETLSSFKTELPQKSEFTMLLEPESLGKISVKLSMEDSKLTISIIAENKLTQQLLVQRGDLLTDSLKQSNINVESYVVEQSRDITAQFMGDPSLYNRQNGQGSSFSSRSSAQSLQGSGQDNSAAESVLQAVRPSSAFIAYA